MPNSAAVRSDDPPPGSDTPAANFTELRSLLVGPEQRQLRALQTRLEDPAAQARDVSRVLATAVELRTRDPHLQRALAPTIEEAITTSVRRNPRRRMPRRSVAGTEECSAPRAWTRHRGSHCARSG